MSTTRKLFRVLPVCLLCLAASAVFWGWIFGFLTDTTADKKISLYHSPSVSSDAALQIRLEEYLPEGIRMAEVRAFDYFLFGTENLEMGDLYIVKESECAQFFSSFRDAPEEAVKGREERICEYTDAESGETARGFIVNPNGYFIEKAETGENLVLFFGKKSAHAEDGKALYALDIILNGKE